MAYMKPHPSVRIFLSTVIIHSEVELDWGACNEEPVINNYNFSQYYMPICELQMVTIWNLQCYYIQHWHCTCMQIIYCYITASAHFYNSQIISMGHSMWKCEINQFSESFPFDQLRFFWFFAHWNKLYMMKKYKISRLNHIYILTKLWPIEEGGGHSKIATKMSTENFCLTLTLYNFWTTEDRGLKFSGITHGHLWSREM